MSKKCEIAAKLDEAADYMLEHGWTQHVLDKASGEVCALGSIYYVTGYQPASWDHTGARIHGDIPWDTALWQLRQETVAALENEVRETTRFPSVPRWNDYGGRTTPTKIVSTMRGLAARLRKEADCG